MLLQDFNYFFNKAVNQYINKRYNIYDINQQTTDDLRVLKSTAFLEPLNTKTTKSDSEKTDEEKIKEAVCRGIYEFVLPTDYLHMLNCICVYQLDKRWKCYDKNEYVQFAAKRLTADAWSVIINDYYNRPLPTRPYFYIHNINTNDDGQVPTNPIKMTDESNEFVLSKDFTGTDSIANYSKDNSNLPRTIDLTNIKNKSLVEREAGVRYGNASNVRMEIRYGQDDVFKLKKVLVDYIKAPQTIRLTQEQVNLTEDTSQIMEFPDYVCQEIINELVMLVMENTADPRLQTNTAVTKSIANPVQQQTQQSQD